MFCSIPFKSVFHELLRNLPNFKILGWTTDTNEPHEKIFSLLVLPRHSPPGIQYVQSALDSLVAKGVPNSIDSFSIGAYKAKLEEKSIATGFKMPKVVPPKVELKNP